MNVEDCIFFRLAKASQAAVGFWGEKTARHGLTAVQSLVLTFLGEEDGVTSSALGEKLRITSATMSGILDRLEKLALVERKPHPDDRRAVRVCLTPHGAELARDLRQLSIEANEEFLSRFSPEEAAFFKSLLKRVVDG